MLRPKRLMDREENDGSGSGTSIRNQSAQRQSSSSAWSNAVWSARRPQAWLFEPPPMAAAGLTSPRRPDLWLPSLRRSDVPTWSAASYQDEKPLVFRVAKRTEGWSFSIEQRDAAFALSSAHPHPMTDLLNLTHATQRPAMPT